MAECVGWDCGAGAIRIANIDIRYRPEPQLITDLKGKFSRIYFKISFFLVNSFIYAVVTFVKV